MLCSFWPAIERQSRRAPDRAPRPGRARCHGRRCRSRRRRCGSLCPSISMNWFISQRTMACATVSLMLSPDLVMLVPLSPRTVPANGACALPRSRIHLLQPVAILVVSGGLPMAEIGIGLVGGGYMGKAHAVALSAVGAVFDTALAAPAGDDRGHQPDVGRALSRGLWLCPRDGATGGIWSPTRRWRRWSSPRRSPPTARLPRRPLRRASRCSAKSRWAPRWRMRGRWSRRPRPRACRT